MLPLPEQSTLRDLFEYTDGELRWAKNKGTAKAGDIAGVIHYSGYRQVKLSGKVYRVHRLIWMYVTGEDPGQSTVDHVDGNKLNNAWENLRLATAFQQQMNKPGAKGVYKLKRVKKDRWVACFRHNQLGIFDTEQEARDAYLKAYREAAGEFAHTQR